NAALRARAGSAPKRAAAKGSRTARGSDRTTGTGRLREVITGSVRAVALPASADASTSRPDPRELLPAPPAVKSAFRQRFGVVHNPHGPRIRLGILWAIVVFGSFAFAWMRPYGLATVYAVAAGLAALQIVDAWHRDHGGA